MKTMKIFPVSTTANSRKFSARIYAVVIGTVAVLAKYDNNRDLLECDLFPHSQVVKMFPGVLKQCAAWRLF